MHRRMLIICTWRCAILLFAPLALVEGAGPLTSRPEEYLLLRANDSYIGQPVPCTHEEKLCFQYNLIYNIDSGKCYSIGYLISGYRNIGDRYEFLNGAGHLRGRLYGSSCSGYRMMYDGICHREREVHEICGCDAEPTLYFLGNAEWECRCSPATRVHVGQPEVEGKCRIPDLRFPDNGSQFFRNQFEDIQGFSVDEYVFLGSQLMRTLLFSEPRFACSSEQLECFAEGKVWVPEGSGCFVVLERGPCREDHVVALDVHVAREGHVVATCVHARGGCIEGHVRVAFDGQCHNATDLVVPGTVLRNQFGIFVVVPSSVDGMAYTPKVFNGTELATGQCGVGTSPHCATGLQGSGSIPCHNKNGCGRYEAEEKERSKPQT